ncbi:MAG: DUF547 domain-containing protein [Bacteroidota bacterium]|nr:DUF547 domain-containing protein [Bacteroidota bacterium]
MILAIRILSSRPGKVYCLLAIASSIMFISHSSLSQGHDTLHAEYTAVLRAHVEDGLVNYTELQQDSRLERYLARLATIDPDKLPSRDERLAYWLNLYNASTLSLVTVHYPLHSIRAIKLPSDRRATEPRARSPWDVKFVRTKDDTLTLNEIEHGIIRTAFDDPRIHFALNCAAVSCPPLRNEAYVSGVLQEQLEDQTRKFIRDKRRQRFDRPNRTAHISMVFKWYAADFGGTSTAVLDFIRRYLPRSSTFPREGWNIQFLEYDWTLNDIAQ